MELLYVTCMIGHGRPNENQAIECGFKDVCDVIQYILVIGALLFACVIVVLRPIPIPAGVPIDYVFWVAILGSLILAAILLFLLGQLFVVISKLPLLMSFGGGFLGRIIAALAFLLTAGGIIAGILMFALVAIQAFPAEKGGNG